jgi:regulatory protein NPR1
MFMDDLLTPFSFVVVDTNLRNGRGLTVLHVAAWRREPQIIGSLLDKGARLDELTMNNQRAIDISRRLASILVLEREETKKDHLCIDLLEQAEKRHNSKCCSVECTVY